MAESLREAGPLSAPRRRQCNMAGARVAVLGYAYLENSDDTRNTPSAPLVAVLRTAGAEVVIHDPFVAPYNGDWRAVVAGADAVVAMIGHDGYRSIDLRELRSAVSTALLVGAHVRQNAG